MSGGGMSCGGNGNGGGGDGHLSVERPRLLPGALLRLSFLAPRRRLCLLHRSPRLAPRRRRLRRLRRLLLRRRRRRGGHRRLFLVPLVLGLLAPRRRLCAPLLL